MRWWHKNKNKFIFENIFGNCIPIWKEVNPFYYKHEYKLVRVKIHRALRRNNKIKIQKGFDVEVEQKTNGWITH